MNEPISTAENLSHIDLDNYKEQSVGAILRKTREHYGKSLAEVEGDLRIRVSQLEAIESLRLDKLPGRVYAIGFVRSYSEYLGLDGDKMVQLFKAQSVGKRVKPNLKFPVTYEEGNTPNLFIILFSLVGLILLISYWVIFNAPTKYVEAVPSVPEIFKESRVDLLQPAPKQKTVQIEVLAQEKPNVMELVITQESWVEIKNAQGKKLISQVLNAGDKYIVPDEEGLLLTTGNAGGVSVFIKGEDKGTIGKTSQVKRRIRLDRENFTN